MPVAAYLKAAALSPRVSVANPAENARASLEAIQMALRAGAQAIALPELGLSGCTCGDLFSQPALPDACESSLRWLAEQTKHSAALIAVGLPAWVDGRLCDCAAVLQSGNILGLASKRDLSPGERRWFAPGAGGRLFQCGACAIGVGFGEGIPGAQVLLRLAAEPEEAGLHEQRRSLLSARSLQGRCGIVYAGAGAGESSTDLVFSGPCLVAENGEILTENRRYEPGGGAVYACLDLELLRAARRGLPAPSMGNSIPCAPLPALRDEHLTRKYSPSPFVPQSPQLRAGRCREVLDMQTAALVQRLRHTGQRQVILGLSGGVDSTLALLVAARAADQLQWPRESVLCITMPGYGTSDFTRETAGLLAAAFGATLWEIDIRPACDLHMQDIGHDPGVRDATYENVQARERTQILMDLANQEGALLLGTGDLSEIALGWCTYNADHMSMYNPNCGVPKTLTRAVVQYAMEEAAPGPAAALARALGTPVSPELLPGAQKTEDILGSYDVHDFYLYHFCRCGFGPKKLFFMARRAFGETYAPEQLKAWLVIFLRRFFSQQFKRSCSPDGPRVCGVSLSPRGAWQMPSDASAQLWLEEAEGL
ncbi:MAG: NAD(+) synthase [Oscillospiraceae bacterium]|jgi:NAD+ synthase (glutamine-hydrolysing)|nr:NAD(+) synthase [Oscillospiraceae bacterium]